MNIVCFKCGSIDVSTVVEDENYSAWHAYCTKCYNEEYTVEEDEEEESREEDYSSPIGDEPWWQFW